MEIFQPLGPTMVADPYPVYAELRRTDPIYWHEQTRSYVLTSYRDCDQVLQNPQIFASDFRAVGEEVPKEFLSLLNLDPPDHGVIRQILLAALKKVDLSVWLADVGTVAGKLLSTVGEGEFDFVTEFAEPLAARSMCALFGIPLLDEEKAFLVAQHDLVVGMDWWLAPERGPAGVRAGGYLIDLIEPWAAQPPTTGLLSGVDFSAAGERLPYLINSLRAILVAGFSPSNNMLSNAVRVLVEHGFFDREEPPVVTTTMIHELVRYAAPVQAGRHAVVQDVQLGDRLLTRFDVVVTMLGAANRDPEVFEVPDQLRLDRTTNPHLGFGTGIHSCLGARFALRVLLDVLELLAKTYRIELAGDPVQRPTATLRGLSRLPLSLRIR